MTEGFFQNPWALWVGLAAIIFVVGEALLRKRFRWHLILRLFWVAGICLLIADWTKVGSKEFSQPETLSIYFDSSSSVLDLPERRERLKTIMEGLREWSKESEQPYQVYSFSDDVRERTFFDDLSSDYQTLLSPVAEQSVRGEGAQVILSDGNWFDQARLQEKTFGVQLGNEAPERDIWIEDVSSVFTAFLKNRLKIPVQLGHQGFDGEVVQVRLRGASGIIEEREVELSEEVVSLEFSYFPEKMGEAVFLIEFDQVEGELSSLNNQQSFQIRTVRDKIRILHVSGKPSQDLKAWRLFLTRQPDVDLVSFYILRSVTDDPQARNYELSLIPFPYEDLFTVELDRFDVVILHNFDFNLYFQPFYLANLARFVRQGGALMMIGGDQSFHKYRRSPLEPVLPFDYEGPADFVLSQQKARVSSDHPIVEDLEFMFQLMDFEARHEISSRPEAQDLVTYQDGVPLLSIRQFEEGRVVGVNSDELWKVQFKPTQDFVAFSKLARRLLQYLTFDPAMDPKRIESEDWHVGKNVTLSLRSGELIDWRIESFPDGEVLFETNQTEQIEFLVPKPGVYSVTTNILSEPLLFETVEQPGRGEWKTLVRDQRSFERSLEEGRVLSYANWREILDEEITGKQVISASVSPWSRLSTGLSWLILLAVLFFLSLDFYFRKRTNWDA